METVQQLILLAESEDLPGLMNLIKIPIGYALRLKDVLIKVKLGEPHPIGIDGAQRAVTISFNIFDGLRPKNDF